MSGLTKSLFRIVIFLELFWWVDAFYKLCCGEHKARGTEYKL